MTMRKMGTFVAVMLLLCAAASSAFGRYSWYWTLPLRLPLNVTDMQDTFFYLTSHNGSHAVAMTEYDSTGTGTWQV